MHAPFIIFMYLGKCTTIGGRDPNKQCKFPFRFDGITYNSCTFAGNQPGETDPWCSTMVDSSGTHVGGQGKWGNCPSSCAPRKTCMLYLHFTKGEIIFECSYTLVKIATKEND